MVRRIGLSFVTIVALLSVAALPSQAQTVLTHHVRDAVRNGQARLVGKLPSDQVLSLDIVLPLGDPAGLNSFLQQLYDPASPNYRQFLTVAEFTARFGPSQASYDAVVNFAQANGLTVVGVAPNRMNVHVQGTVANIQSAFHLNLNSYQHPTEARTFYSPDREPTTDLPFALWHVAGLDNYSIPKPAGLSHNANPLGRSGATTGSGPSSSFLGSDMRAAYYGGANLTGSGQSLGLLEYYGTDLTDLTTYFTNARQINNIPVTLLSTDGTSTSCLKSKGCDDLEQTIDMTQALGMAPGLSSLVVYVGSSDAAIFNAMATASPLNAQLSSSWTWSPADPNTDNPYFEEFAAQGQNLFQAAGDSGKWTTSGTASEIFPADDVYLTSVGGTDLNTVAAAGSWSSDSAWSDSGGGISPNKFVIPSWQTAAAAGCASCSKTYRNGPDVSANANFTYYVCADQTTCTANEWGGTSFAAPMWAGYLALVNQQAAANGSSMGVGFINPSLYALGGLGTSYGSDFHDVTSGSNGYAATTGYDLATGWGSPNGSGLIDALAPAATSPGFSLSASPTSVSVVQGSNGAATITSTAVDGFDSAVALTASGQPSGVQVSFSPASITGSGTSAMSLAVASSAPAGKYTITITGTAGGVTETTTVSLTVSAAPVPAFTLAASPSTVSARQGSSGTTTITTAVSGGFDAAITLTASGGGSGNTVTLSPSSFTAPGAGKSTLTVKVGAKSATGNQAIIITATGGGITHTATVTLSVKK